jgi:hypothetical protein
MKTIESDFTVKMSDTNSPDKFELHYCRYTFRLLVLCVWLILFVSNVPAQSTAAITGKITDAEGGAVAGATVTITSTTTNQTRTTTADGNGDYHFPVLQVGQYRLSAEQSGFQRHTEQVELHVSDVVVLNISLKIAGIEANVEVTRDELIADTSSPTLGEIVNQKKIEELPLNGRNWTQLALLTPGVQNFTSVAKGSNILESRSNRISINGARNYSSNFLLDGSSANGILRQTPGGSSGNFLGLDTIREFKVVTNSYGAEYGGAAGGVITVISKSGSNEFHGSAFEYLRNDNLDARNFFDRHRPEFKRNQFGGVVGGRILTDELFFFGGYEGYRERLGISGLQIVPDANAHQGLLRDPSTGQLVNVGVAPNVAPFLNSPAFPLPNAGLIGGGLGLHAFTEKLIDDENFFNIRIDSKLSDKDNFFGRYTFLDSNPVRRPNTSSSGFFVNDIGRNQYLTLNHTRTFNEKLVGTAIFTFTRSRIAGTNETGFDITAGMEAAPGVGFPLLIIGGIGNVGTDRTLPRDLIQNQFGYSYDFVYVPGGKHVLKTGVTVQRYQYNTFLASRLQGEFRFGDLRSFLQGRPQQGIIAKPGTITSDSYRNTLFGFYLQDDFKFRPNLTLNLGIRYEPTTTLHELHGKTIGIPKLTEDFYGRFNDSIRTADVQFGGEVYDNPSLKNFMPRIGVAWDVFGDGSTAVRAGFGIFYDPLLAYYALRMPINPPYNTLTTVVNPVFPDILGGVGNVVNSPALLGPIQHDLGSPYTSQWNLNVQRSLPWGTLLTVGYAGSRGRNLITPFDEANSAVPDIRPDGTYFIPAGRGRRSPDFSNILAPGTRGKSSYHSGQLSVLKRLSNDFQAQLSYTFSRLIDNVPPGTSSTNTTTGEGPGYMIPWLPDLDKGLSAMHAKHNLVFNFLYDLPIFRGKSDWTSNFLGGWQVGGIGTYRSGSPFTVAIQGDRARVLNVLSAGYQRPNLAPGRTAESVILGGPDRYFDPTAFTLPAVGTFGTLGRNIFIGPNLINFDAFISKRFRAPFLGEQGNIQLKLDAFNLFNRANFDLPNRIVFAGGTGPTEQPLASAGRITQTVTTSRQLQLGVRIAF